MLFCVYIQIQRKESKFLRKQLQPPEKPLILEICVLYGSIASNTKLPFRFCTRLRICVSASILLLVVFYLLSGLLLTNIKSAFQEEFVGVNFGRTVRLFRNHRYGHSSLSVLCFCHSQDIALVRQISGLIQLVKDSLAPCFHVLNCLNNT